MVAEIRERALRWIDRNIPPLGQQITSDGATAKDFERLTGLTQADLETFWKGHEGTNYSKTNPRPVLTSCNGFVGHYCSAIGLPSELGVFDLEKALRQFGKEHAWINSSGESKPRLGDICRWATTHVGVGLYWDYDGSAWTWYTAEGGQGGPQYEKDTGKFLGGHDIVKRKKYPDAKNAPPNPAFNPGMLLGWVDIELFQLSAEEYVSALWVNEDHHVVHPEAPAGVGGPGRFSSAEILGTHASLHPPHPWAPAAHSLDPLDIEHIREDNENS
jgi:hypothetical protein